MNPYHEDTVSEEWNSWYGSATIGGAVTYLQSTTKYGSFEEEHFQTPMQLPAGFFDQPASYDIGNDWTYLPDPGYEQTPLHVSRQDSGRFLSTSPTQPDGASPSTSPTSQFFESPRAVDRVSREADATTTWSGHQQQHFVQVLTSDRYDATTRALDLERHPPFFDIEVEPLSPAVASTNATARTDPPLIQSADGTLPRRQTPKSASDQYTARWVRGDGTDRTGWCGICSSWHKLKDSAYWYHMHYTHGIICTTGKEFEKHMGSRQARGAIGCEVLCGACHQWVYIGRPGGGQTPYFRHAYKCQIKNRPGSQSLRSQPKSASPRRSTAKQPKQA